MSAVNAGTERRLGVAGRTALASTVAGGVLASGFVLSALAVAGHMRSSTLMLLGSGLYLAGALAGFLHGAVLGYLGRDAGVDRAGARRQIGNAMVYAPLPLAFGWAISGWMALLLGNVLFGNLWLLVGTGFSLGAGVFIVGVAGRQAWEALRNAYARWPERVAGTAAVAGAFVLLSLALLGVPAAALGGGPTALGAVLVAGALAVWVVAPAAVVALRRRSHGA